VELAGENSEAAETMNRSIGLWGILILLSGCAAQVTSSTPRTVVVKAGFPDGGLEKALALADAECGKIGRRARPVYPIAPGTDRYAFDCISEFSGGGMR
jgi:hypothetical protein